ncbi:DUF4240 domain-containing protein [Paractinoplanes lichenicola]|uniref:DUF4240 domain-containing protein n=1 Tax=Paractinoplanes lichenicola TaxID=2802976 RepID=A0ABS1VV62_9ACTN|nr:DUF4240 domain-containing protein [Actinoplanes lichenicola]MBL7258371.1 DUF4240 domain-containing protein [Actinoplanes lichenicola]
MDLDGFWALIERSGRKKNQDERADWLTGELAKLPPAEIESFEILYCGLRDRVDTWHMWGAAALVCDGASDDGFWYFQAWLIGQGREVFEAAAADPDSLADAPAVRALAGRDSDDWSEDEWPDWELLDYVASEAYEEVTDGDDLDDALEARGLIFRASPEPSDPRFELDDPAERHRRYPRLSALFDPVPSL